ncbi:MAG: hypothetical protein JW819_04980 [Candidatus Krumholzibacteriota bacterium]|nr:hypothetical protein [Candidatus Krumholzibacteriota bacterium]
MAAAGVLRERLAPGVPSTRLAALAAFAAATVLLIPLEWYPPGALVWLTALVLVLRDGDAAWRRRLGILLGAVAVLAAAPIHTDTSDTHFVTLGLPFLAVVIVPALVLGRTDPGVIRYRFWPRRLRWIDLIYVGLSLPLAWAVLRLYLFQINPDVPTHWPLPQPRTMEAVWRLFIGINGVGIWDELFFVNTVYAVLRSVLPYRTANVVQAVIYASVLTDMAFTGVGPALVFLFALTQGVMFEESETLLYVLVVHLVVDFYLVGSILAYHYPGWHWGLF